MVMRLPKPGYCSLVMLAKVIAERQGGRNREYFNNIADEWEARTKCYIECGGAPALVNQWPAIEAGKNKFINLYESPDPKSSHGVMLKELRDDHELSICPACGEFGEPNTLDHYLPKSKYPHFSVTPDNLFPMCDSCQELKGSKTGDALELRYFLHPYFDLFIYFQIIQLTILPPFNKPGFKLMPHPIWQGWRKGLIVSHMRELEIEKRYVKFFRNEYKRLVRLVVSMRGKNQDVRAVLESKVEALEFPTRNSWEYIFYSGVFLNSDLMDYLILGGLPPYP